jgi:hypothetical protein
VSKRSAEKSRKPISGFERSSEPLLVSGTLRLNGPSDLDRLKKLKIEH